MRTFLRSAFIASITLRSAIISTSTANTSSLLTPPIVNHLKESIRRTIKTTTFSLKMSNGNSDGDINDYPDLLVYDMDACLWDQEMYEMSSMPDPNRNVIGDLNGRGQGVVGVMSGYHKISLHKGSLISLQEHWDGKYPDMKIAMASSADTPFAEKVGRATLKILEILPSVTVWDVLMRDWDNEDINQIGRQPPLSSNKSATHFPILREKTGIRYDRMLFFDDCNWGDHCGMVERNCKEGDSGLGPATVRTPNGLGEREFRKGLEAFRKRCKK